MEARRRAGVLMPVFSLPGDWGIGCFSQHAVRFVEQLAQAGQSIWQILPLGPTGYADSPYQSFSTFAGNPYFIDPDQLIAAGLLTRDELAGLDWGADENRIDYGALFDSRHHALRTASRRFGDLAADADYRAFAKSAGHWLDDYALFMTIKQAQRSHAWTSWPAELRNREPDALDRVREQYPAELDHHRWTQWQFTRQWDALHATARQAGVAIMGDLPIYVAMDSADTWANPELFDLDEELVPHEVAGVPPDGFSATGQLWGNPLYDWQAHRTSGYAWWIRRLAHQLAGCEMLRLDHFRGLESYFAVPHGDPDARNGRWRPGPGIDFLDAVRGALGEFPLIAEDLGYLTEAVHELRNAAGLPGMQIIQFAFDSREPADYWPHNFVRDAVVYTGTHDNDTLRGWWDGVSEPDRQRTLRYLHSYWTPADRRHWDFITLALRSVVDTCIVPMPDYLGLGSEARINAPSTISGNWRWRMAPGAFDRQLTATMAELADLTERR